MRKLRYIGVTKGSGPAALAVLLLCVTVPHGQTQTGTVYSQLWGQKGEKWNAAGILKDFSRVGYHAGDAAIPDYPVKLNVRDVGAKGDGIADDTEPFRKAIQDCPAGGAVWVPNGTYKISDWLQFKDKTDFALRGESRDKTILWFPLGLEEIHPRSAQTSHGTTTTAWSWSGGYLWFENPRELGIENLTFKYPDKQYPGHFLERGYNGINYKGAKDCWVRNVGFYNVDLGMNLDAGSVNNTVAGVFFDAYAGRRNGAEGSHHGIQVSGATTKANLITGFEFTLYGSSIHELTVDWTTSGNVFATCKGANMHLDHHKAPGPDGPFGNLWTDIDIGEGTALWMNNASGSNVDDVFWNIRARRNVAAPAANLKNITVGFPTAQAASLNTARPWLEPLQPGDLSPQNLYLAQLGFRGGNTAVRSRPLAAPSRPVGRVESGAVWYAYPLRKRTEVDAEGRRIPTERRP